MTQVTFRLATEKDKQVFPWKREGINQTRPTVVTMNGHIVLMMHGSRLLYQRGDIIGEETIASLLRAQIKVYEALSCMGYEGRTEVSRRGKESRLNSQYEDPWVALRRLVNG